MIHLHVNIKLQGTVMGLLYFFAATRLVSTVGKQLQEVMIPVKAGNIDVPVSPLMYRKEVCAHQSVYSCCLTLFSLFAMRALRIYSIVKAIEVQNVFFRSQRVEKYSTFETLQWRRSETNKTPAECHIKLVEILNNSYNTGEEKLILLLSSAPRNIFRLQSYSRKKVSEWAAEQFSDSAQFCKPWSLCTICKHQQTSVDSVGDKVTQQQTAGPEK